MTPPTTTITNLPPISAGQLGPSGLLAMDGANGVTGKITVEGLARIDRLANGTYNVKDFGATGDGVTDDSAALTAANDAVFAAGGEVYFPPGAYLIGHALAFSAGVTLRFSANARIYDPAGHGLSAAGTVIALTTNPYNGTSTFAFNGSPNYVGTGIVAGWASDMSGDVIVRGGTLAVGGPQPVGFVSWADPPTGADRGSFFNIGIAGGWTRHISDQTWKESLHVVTVGYVTAAPYAGAAVIGTVGEARVGALNTQNWTGYVGGSGGINVALMGANGTVCIDAGSTGTISAAAAFWTDAHFNLQGAAVSAYIGYYCAAPKLEGSAGTSTVAATYGLFIEGPMTQGTVANHAIFVQGGTSYFGGAIGLGVLVPAAPFALDAEVALTAAVPASSGTVQSNGARIRMGSATSGTAILDMGLAGGTGAWLQSTDATDLSMHFPLLLNPNGGQVTTGAALVAGAGFGCNGATAQTAVVSGGALAGYVTGAFGLDSSAHMQALFNLVAAMRTALVANGIMS